MPDYLVDKRDLRFVLFEQFDLDGLAKLPVYSEMGRDTFEMILDQAVTFAKEVLAPTREPADAEGCTWSDGKVRVPSSYADLWKQYAEQGWLAMNRPAEFGGMGLPMPLSVAVMEMGIGAGSSFIFYPGLTLAAGHLLEVYAEEELRDLVVPKLYSGEWSGTMCLTEPHAGTSVGDSSTVAVPLDDSGREFSIRGNKIFISAAEHDLTENIVHLVLGRVEGDPAGTKGLSLFLVPRTRFDAQGNLGEDNDVLCTGIEHKMGLHGSATCQLAFGDNENCRGYLVGEQGKGINAMFQMMNEARLVTGLQGTAAANFAYQLALAYAKDRKQGAKVSEPGGESVTIVEHPDVRRNLMLCKAISEGTRALALQGGFWADLAEHHEDEATRAKYQGLLDLFTPIIKAYSTDQGFKVTEIAIQVHGGYGYIREYGVEQIMRDTKIASIYEGTNGVQALDLLGRKMRLNGGALFMSYLQEVNSFCEEHGEHGTLGHLVAAVGKAKDQLGAVAMNFAAQGQQSPEVAIIGATPFLEMFGHVETGRLLVDQAIIAQRALDALVAEKGESEESLVDRNDDARFYFNKVRTAEFFVHTILPHATALAKAIKSDDRSALDARL
ncbi:MAG: acyl-CoA dehydrogenase [Myxococcota bacterium]